MHLTSRARTGLWTVCAVVLLVVYLPLAVVTINSFNSDRTFGWPPPGLTLRWWQLAGQAQGPRDALWTSVQAGLGATALALVLGTLLSLALTRYKFFGRQAISLLVVLPIALPGIVTGVALQSVIQNVLDPVFGINAGLFTIIVGHATFCIVVVFNNVTARLRRFGGSLEAASADLGARPLTTFRLVTTFTAGPGSPTLPIWIFNNLFRPNQAPVVNVVAVVLVLSSILPVWLAQRLGGNAAAEGRL